MKQKRLLLFLLVSSFAVFINLIAEPVNIAEDDASQSAYGSGWDNGKNGGSGFEAWTCTNEGNDESRHSGFFIADTERNQDLNGIAKEKKAFGLFANGIGFEQAVAYRAFQKPLQEGDSFSFMMENGPFEKKFDKDAIDTGVTGSVGLTLRSGNANTSPNDYNTGAVFEFGSYQGKPNYQIYDGTENTDSGVPFSDFGVSVTVTILSADSYDLEIQDLRSKKITKLPGRKLKASTAIASLAVFNRNSEKYDAFFNQFQVSRESQ